MKFIHRGWNAVRWMWANTDAITKWIQIIGLAVAAYWAYTRFCVEEKPSLEIRVDASENLHGELPGPFPNSCYVYLDLMLKNQGAVSFNVTGAHIQAWRADLAEQSTTSPMYVDPDKLKHGKEIIDINSKNLLDMHFSPGESAGRTFTWVLRRPLPGIYLFMIDLNAINAREKKHVSVSIWSQNLCSDKYPTDAPTRQ